MRLCNVCWRSQLPYLDLHILLYMAVGFQRVIWKVTFISGSITRLSDEDSGEGMNVRLVYSAVPLDERSQCIVKSPGSLPGKVRETRLSRWYLSTTLYIQIPVALRGQSSDITAFVPCFSSIFPSDTLGFQRLVSIYFIETWENCTWRDCLPFLVICVTCETGKSLLLVAEELNTTAVILYIELD